VIAAWNRYVFGAWDVRSGYGQSYDAVVPGATRGLGWYAENTLGFLVSPDRGILVWTPLLLLLLPAVVRGWAGTPLWSRWLAAGGVVYTASQLSLNVFHGGDVFYGYRLGLELMVCLVPLYVFSFRSVGRVARAWLPAVVGAQFAAIALGSVFDIFYVVDDEVWRDNSLWLALRTLPLLAGSFLALCFVVGVLATRLALGPTALRTGSGRFARVTTRVERP
jgi:hypothetical protein